MAEPQIDFLDNDLENGLIDNFYTIRLKIEELIRIKKFKEYQNLNIVVNIFNPYFDEFELPITSGKFSFPPLEPIGKKTILWELYENKEISEFFSSKLSSEPLFKNSKFISREKIRSCGFIKLFHEDMFFGFIFFNKHYPIEFQPNEKKKYKKIAEEIGKLLYRYFEYPVLSNYLQNYSKCDFLLLIDHDKINNNNSLSIIQKNNKIYLKDKVITDKLIGYVKEKKIEINKFINIKGSPIWRDISTIIDLDGISYIRAIQLGLHQELDGLLLFGYKNQFDPRDQIDFIFRHIGFQMSLHLNHYHQILDCMKKRAEVFAINDFTRKLSYQVNNLHAVFTNILGYAMALTDAIFGSIELIKNDGLQFECVLPDENGDRLVFLNNGLQKFKNDVPHFLLSSEESAVIIDHTNVNNKYFSFIDENTKKTIAIELYDKERVIGVLRLESNNVNGFVKSDEDMLMNVVDFIETIMQKSMQYEFFHEITQVIDSFNEITLDSKEIWKRILESTKQIIGADYGSISVLLDDGITIIDLVRNNYPENNNAKTFNINEEKSIIAWAARNQTNVLCGNVILDPEWKDKYYAIFNGAKSELTVPIIEKKQLVCVMNFESKTENAFDEDDIFIINSVADIFIRAVRNSEFYKKLEKANIYLKSLNEATQEIAMTTLELDPLLRSLLNHAINITKSNYGVILKYRDQKFRLSQVYPSSYLEKIKKIILEPTKENLRICEECADKSEIIIVEDSKQKGYKTLSGQTDSSLLALPIIQNNVVTGVLVVERNYPSNFLEDDINALTSLINLVVLTFDKAKYIKSIDSMSINTVKNLKTPLSRIMALINEENRSIDILPAKFQVLFSKIEGEIQKEEQYIDQLTKWDPKESQIFLNNLVYRRTNIVDLLFNVKILLTSFSDKKGITLNINSPKFLYCSIDSDLILIALTNVIYNAIYYSQNLTQVIISCKLSNGYVFISIEDQGPGLTENELVHLFQPENKSVIYDKENYSNNSNLQKTKEIIEMHGGSINVESVIDKGTKFLIVLPLRPEGGLSN